MSGFSLTWTWALLGLLVVPLLVVGYRRVLRVQEARRAALAAGGLVMPAPRGRGRHLGPALLIAALAGMGVALARPGGAGARAPRGGPGGGALRPSHNQGGGG